MGSVVLPVALDLALDVRHGAGLVVVSQSGSGMRAGRRRDQPL
jgi:hypothetical protein